MPSPHAAVQRKKVFYGAPVELFGHPFLMVRKGGCRVPARLKVLLRQVQILPGTHYSNCCIQCPVSRRATHGLAFFNSVLHILIRLRTGDSLAPSPTVYLWL